MRKRIYGKFFFVDFLKVFADLNIIFPCKKNKEKVCINLSSTSKELPKRVKIISMVLVKKMERNVIKRRQFLTLRIH